MGVINGIKSSIYKELTKIRFKGIALALRSNGGVHCPICGYKGFTFLPFGLDKRANALCQVCNSKERQRLTAIQLEKLQLRDGLRLLHVAPDPELSSFLKRRYSIQETKIDKRVHGYTYPKSTVTMDLTNLTFQDGSFDLVLCLHVLMYIEDDIKAMQELHRVMADNATALITVSQDRKRKETFSSVEIASDEDRHRYYGHPDSNKVYGKDFNERLSTVGFEVTELDVSQSFSHNEIFQYGLNINETLFIAKKKYGS